MKLPKPTTDAAWLAARFAVLPLVIVSSFYSGKQLAAHCISYLAPEISRSSGQPTGKMVHATSLQIQGQPAFYGFLSVLFLVVFVVVTFLQLGGPRRYRLRQRFAKKQIIASLASIIITVPIYWVMYLHSQWRYFPHWSCSSSGQITGYSMGGVAKFGLGIAPVLAILLMTVYVLAGCVPYLLLRNNNRRVGGQITRDLFQ